MTKTLTPEEMADNFLMLNTWDHQAALRRISDEEFVTVTPLILERMGRAGLGNYADWLIASVGRQREIRRDG